MSEFSWGYSSALGHLPMSQSWISRKFRISRNSWGYSNENIWISLRIFKCPRASPNVTELNILKFWISRKSWGYSNLNFWISLRILKCRCSWFYILIGYNSLKNETIRKSMGCFKKFRKFPIWWTLRFSNLVKGELRKLSLKILTWFLKVCFLSHITALLIFLGE